MVLGKVLSKIYYQHNRFSKVYLSVVQQQLQQQPGGYSIISGVATICSPSRVHLASSLCGGAPVVDMTTY